METMESNSYSPLEFSAKIPLDPEMSSGSYHLHVIRSGRSDLSLDREPVWPSGKAVGW